MLFRSYVKAILTAMILIATPQVAMAQRSALSEENRQIATAILFNQVSNEIVDRSNLEILRAQQEAEEAQRRAQNAERREQAAIIKAREAEQLAELSIRASRSDRAARRSAEADRDSARREEQAAKAEVVLERRALESSRQAYLKEVERFDIESKAYVQGLTNGVEALIRRDDPRLAEALKRVSNGDWAALDQIAEFVDIAQAARAKAVEARVSAIRRAEQFEAGVAMMTVAKLFDTAYDLGQRTLSERLSRWESVVATDPDSFDAWSGLRDAIAEEASEGDLERSARRPETLTHLIRLTRTEEHKTRLNVICAYISSDEKRALCPGGLSQLGYMKAALESRLGAIRAKQTQSTSDLYYSGGLLRQAGSIAATTTGKLDAQSKTAQLGEASQYLSEHKEIVELLERDWVPSKGVTYMLARERSLAASVRAEIASANGQQDESMRLYINALDLMRTAQADEPPSLSKTIALASALDSAAIQAWNLGDGTRTVTWRTEAVQAYRNSPTPRPMSLWFALRRQALAAMRFNQPETAVAAFKEGIELARTISNNWGISLNLSDIQLVQLMTNDLAGARQSFAAAKISRRREIEEMQEGPSTTIDELLDEEIKLLREEASLLQAIGELRSADAILVSALDQIVEARRLRNISVVLIRSELVLHMLRATYAVELRDFDLMAHQFEKAISILESAPVGLLAEMGWSHSQGVHAQVRLYQLAISGAAPTEPLNRIISLAEETIKSRPPDSGESIHAKLVKSTAESFRSEIVILKEQTPSSRLLLLSKISSGRALESNPALDLIERTVRASYWANAQDLIGLLRSTEVTWKQIAEEYRSFAARGWADTIGWYPQLARATVRARQEADGMLPR
jgi:hypothetical protein